MLDLDNFNYGIDRYSELGISPLQLKLDGSEYMKHQLRDWVKEKLGADLVSNMTDSDVSGYILEQGYIPMKCNSEDIIFLVPLGDLEKYKMVKSYWIDEKGDYNYG